MKKLLFLVLAVVAAGAVAWFFLGRRVDVETVRVSKGSLVRTVEEDGVVEAPDDRKIFATQVSRVVEVHVEAGEAVARGQVLVRMKNPDLDVRTAETRTLLEQAARERRGAASRVGSVRLLLEDAVKNAGRRERLYEAGAISLSELEEARLIADRLGKDFAEARSAEGAAVALESGLRRTLSELQAKGGELVVKSPIKGIVLELPAEKDKVFQTGDHVVTVAPDDRMEVVSDVLSDALGGRGGRPEGPRFCPDPRKQRPGRQRFKDLSTGRGKTFRPWRGPAASESEGRPALFPAAQAGFRGPRGDRNVTPCRS